MVELLKGERNCLRRLCKGKDYVELYACLEGKMGKAFVDRKEHPVMAIILVADFCFLLGEIRENVDETSIKKVLDKYTHKIIILYHKSWISVLEKYYLDSLKKFNRYAIKKEVDVFKKDVLKRYVSAVEPEFKIDRIDEKIYYKVIKDDFMADCCCNYSSLEDFLANGFGYVIEKDGKIISAASTYSYCDGAIDITIGTHDEYRRKGLALAVASKLILECMERNIYPLWDAANLGSVALAEKLGYHFDKEYEVYYIS